MSTRLHSLILWDELGESRVKVATKEVLGYRVGLDLSRACLHTLLPPTHPCIITLIAYVIISFH